MVAWRYLLSSLLQRHGLRHTVFQYEMIHFSFNCKFPAVASESRYSQTMFVRGSVSASYVREASIYCVDESECGLGKTLSFVLNIVLI